MGKLHKGFAAMNPEKQRAIASLGGKTGGRHEWTREEAAEAGRKGAVSRREKLLTL